MRVLRTSTIELFKEAMKFSAGHFTVFNQTRRERLHGHNFTVYCSIMGEVDANGMVSDYRVYKERLQTLCADWDEIFLLAGQSPYLRFEEKGSRIDVHFGDEVIPFLTSDVKILPVRNVTLEELSHLFLAEVLKHHDMLMRDRIHEVVIKVSSGPGQLASSQWRRES